MFKNVASQSVTLLAVNVSTGLPVTGDAANQVYYVSKDDGTVTAIAASSGVPTEIDSTNAKGLYKIALAQAETNADKLLFSGKSTTANVTIVPTVIYTAPPNYTKLAIDSSGDVTYNNAAPPTAAAIATGVWQDATAGDFAVASSIGKSLYTSGNAPGAASGFLIAGINAATTIDGLTLTGTAAAGATPATAGLTVTGGAASTTSGGTSAAAVSLTGGAGAASTNGAASGLTVIAGGTTTVSGADAATLTGTGNGSGLTLVHAGTGKDLNAQTTNALQVNVVQINAVSASSVTTVNANIGLTQPANFTGTGASALLQADTRDFLGHAVVLDAQNYPGVNVVDISGTANASATAGKVAATVASGDAVDTAPALTTTVSAAGANSITFPSGASTVDTRYRDHWVQHVPTGQWREIYSYTGSTLRALITPNWDTTPTNGDAVRVYPRAAMDVGMWAAALAQSSLSHAGYPAVDAVFLANQLTALDSNSLLQVDVNYWNGTAVATPATAGVPDVNVKNYNNQTAATDANNLPKVDTADWGGVGVGGMPNSTTPPTTAAIATAVWTDTTAGDFTTASSPGKILVSQLGGTFTTTSSSIFTAAALANAPTGSLTAAAIATAVLTDTTAGDLGTQGSIGYVITHQLGGTFTSTTSSIFTSAALANAPGGAGSGTTAVTDLAGGTSRNPSIQTVQNQGGQPIQGATVTAYNAAAYTANPATAAILAIASTNALGGWTLNIPTGEGAVTLVVAATSDQTQVVASAFVV